VCVGWTRSAAQAGQKEQHRPTVAEIAELLLGSLWRWNKGEAAAAAHHEIEGRLWISKNSSQFKPAWLPDPFAKITNFMQNETETRGARRGEASCQPAKPDRKSQDSRSSGNVQQNEGSAGLQEQSVMEARVCWSFSLFVLYFWKQGLSTAETHTSALLLTGQGLNLDLQSKKRKRASSLSLRLKLPAASSVALHCNAVRRLYHLSPPLSCQVLSISLSSGSAHHVDPCGRCRIYMTHAMPHPASAENGKDLDNCIVVAVTVVVGEDGRSDEDCRRMCEGGKRRAIKLQRSIVLSRIRVAAAHLHA